MQRSGVMAYLNYNIFKKVLDVISWNAGKIYRVDAVSLKAKSRKLKNCCQAIASTGLSKKKLRRVRYFFRVNFTRVQLISKKIYYISGQSLFCQFLLKVSLNLPI